MALLVMRLHALDVPDREPNPRTLIAILHHHETKTKWKGQEVAVEQKV